MAADELTKPLGLDREPKRSSGRSLPLGRVLAATCLGVLTSLTGYVALTSDPLGGEPIATASIEQTSKRPASTAEAPAAGPADTPNVKHMPERQASSQTAQESEQDAGVRVMRQNGQAPGSVFIRVPDAQAMTKLAPAPDRRLSERGRHGLLPKQGPEGLRAADIYARPVTSQQRNAPVRIAIVVGGLGINGALTQEAVQRLNPSISLAFAPYGADLERQAARAREDGHEVLLQAPMEPFDYPDNDPGPHTLAVSLPAEQVADRLQWLLARFPGYVGVVNFMGGRFMSSEPALSPVLKEIRARGLLFMDDGTSGRSIAPQIADSIGLSHAKADVVIDAVQRAVEIDAALARLERIAREKGSAIGSSAALPVTIDRIARWAKAARGTRRDPGAPHRAGHVAQEKLDLRDAEGFRSASLPPLRRRDAHQSGRSGLDRRPPQGCDARACRRRLFVADAAGRARSR